MGFPSRSVKVAGKCGFCGSDIPVLDFQERRAAVVTGRNCCAGCLEGGAWFGTGRAPRPSNAPEARACPRFTPSLQLDLELRLPGWRGTIGRNLALEWLDVSESGFRAIVRKVLAVGALLSARIHHLPARRTYPLVAYVRRVQGSDRFGGSLLAGIEFVEPTEEFRTLIRKLHGLDPGAVAPSPDVKRARNR
jgi:hypothetical protein